MKIIVLAAGFATRLWPLTKNCAKPLLDIGGRTVLDRLLEVGLRCPAIEEIVLVTNARFRADFDAWRTRASIPVPVDILDDGAMHAEELRGALADLSLALDHTSASNDGYMVLAGDNLIDFELAPYVTQFQDAGRPPTLLVRRIEGGVPPRRYGEVLCDAHERVLRFREKPAQPESDLAATGLYLMPRDVPQHLRRYLESGGHEDAPGHFIAWLCEREKVFARQTSGTLWDIGNLESLELARRAFT